MELQLEKVVQLFTYLQDKDLFAEIYRNLLAKRLLNKRSASDDARKMHDFHAQITLWFAVYPKNGRND